MSENIIYCYSGSGHCLDMAKSIARALGDTDIVLMRSFPAVTDTTGAKRVGFVFPCYGGGLPGDVEEYVKAIHIEPGTYTFAVEQFAGYMGCGLHKIDEIVDLDYWNTISNHSTCIWLMPHTLTFPPTSKDKAQLRLNITAAEVAAAVKAMKRSEKKPPKKAFFALESKGFSGMHAARSKKFAANGSCIGCGTCVRICPRGNIPAASAVSSSARRAPSTSARSPRNASASRTRTSRPRSSPRKSSTSIELHPPPQTRKNKKRLPQQTLRQPFSLSNGQQ